MGNMWSIKQKEKQSDCPHAWCMECAHSTLQQQDQLPENRQDIKWTWQPLAIHASQTKASILRLFVATERRGSGRWICGIGIYGIYEGIYGEDVGSMDTLKPNFYTN